MEGLWSSLQKILDEIVHLYALRFIVVFGPDRTSAPVENALPVVAAAGDVFCDAWPGEGGGVSFDPSALPAKYRDEACDSVGPRAQQILGCLRNVDLASLGDVRLLTVPVVAGRNRYVAMLLGYAAENPSISEENKKNGILDSPVRAFYGAVRANLSSVLATASESRSNEILRVFKHELYTIASGLTLLNDAYIADFGFLKSLDERKLRDLSKDIGSAVKKLDVIHKIAKGVDPDSPLPPLRRVEFMLLGEIFLKWKDIHRQQLRRDRLLIEVPSLSSADLSRPPIFADKELLEVAVFNLLDNAIKYCARGTRIYLDCVRVASENEHVLSVVNFGRSVAGGAEIYECFVRGSNTGNREGLGVGLYLAKRIAAAHGGRVVHSSSFVTSFNLLGARAYLAAARGRREDPFVSQIEGSLASERVVEAERRMVACDPNGNRLLAIGSTEARSMIVQPTYEVRFELRIPGRSGSTQGGQG